MATPITRREITGISILFDLRKKFMAIPVPASKSRRPDTNEERLKALSIANFS
jgi:hypothetical protein